MFIKKFFIGFLCVDLLFEQEKKSINEKKCVVHSSLLIYFQGIDCIRAMDKRISVDVVLRVNFSYFTHISFGGNTKVIFICIHGISIKLEYWLIKVSNC